MSKLIKIIEELDAEKARSAKFESDLAAEREKNRQREFSAWIGSEEMRIKVSPAMMPELIDILEFAATTESYEFSAPDPQDASKTVKVKQAPAEKVKAFMQRYLPELVTFGEVATKNKAGAKTIGAGGTMADILETSRLALEFQASEARSGRTITITEAVNHTMQNG